MLHYLDLREIGKAKARVNHAKLRLLTGRGETGFFGAGFVMECV